MKRHILLLLIFSISMITVSCAPQQAEEEPQFLDVQLTITPEKAEVNKKIQFEAKVTYGPEEVEDADEVKFEVWRANAEEHEKIVVKHSEKGIYKLEKSFAEEGTYYIIAHVTARSMHNMPKEEFVVGTPSEPEKQDHSDSNDTNMEESEHDKESH